MYDIENKRDICYCFYFFLVGLVKKYVNKIISFYMDILICLFKYFNMIYYVWCMLGEIWCN